MDQTIQLGRSDVRVSRVVFGAMAMSATAHDPRRRIETVHAAIEAGITSIDTAPLYEFGGSEQLLGRALAGMRDRVQILTKVGLRWDDPRGQVLFAFRDEYGKQQAVRKNSRPDSIRLEVERSLARLRIDVLDLVQVHHPDPDTPIAETMGALAELLRAGKLRAIGVSNYSAEQMRQAQAALGTIPLASNQVHYSLLERWPETEVLPIARKERVGVLAYSPLEQGLLASDVRADRFGEGDMRKQNPRFHPENLARVSAAVERALLPIARARDASVAQVALAWPLAQSAMSAVIVGASSIEQVQRNAAAAELRLRSDELLAIRQAFEGVQLDPHAGRGALTRVRARMRGVLSRARRRLVRG